MKIEIQTKESFKVVGLSVRTNNINEFSASGKISGTIQNFISNDLASRIKGRLHPGILVCCYTNYESDHHGDYTYIAGEMVDNSVQEAPAGLTLLEVPAQTYLKITNGPGAMPSVVIDVWKKIWEMPSVELPQARSYQTDFEIYDERAQDPSVATVEVCIGIK